MIKRIIKLHAGGIIYFTKDEMEKFGIKIGDGVDLSDYFKEEITININKKDKTYKKLR